MPWHARARWRHGDVELLAVLLIASSKLGRVFERDVGCERVVCFSPEVFAKSRIALENVCS
jgi:hypothetical protein